MIARAPFGRTEHMSSRAVFGAAALGKVSQDVADRALDVLLEYDVNHIDTAASYGDAEDRIGPWMREHRQHFFLATKTGERTKAKAWDQFRRSLDRLRTDHVDLLQLHFLIDEGEWQTAMGADGALEAVLEAQAQGLTRFVGVTRHELAAPGIHLRSLEEYDFDSVLLPYNYLLPERGVSPRVRGAAPGVPGAKRGCADHQVRGRQALSSTRKGGTIGSGDIPRSATSVRTPSSRTHHGIPYVHQNGSSPL